MRVGIVTTWGERCGLAEYSRNIVKHLPEVNWRIIGREDWPGLVEISKDCDLVHIMHHGGLMTWVTPDLVRACGKTVVTRQCIGDEGIFNAATVKTSHIKTDGYRWIPHGIPVVDVASVKDMGGPAIGCAGIPFNGKGHLEAVEIARRLGWRLNLIAPESPHTNAPAFATDVEKRCARVGVECYIITKWLNEENVVRLLALNDVNVFYYTRPANGISGAVRLGLAARKPVIVSEHSQFHDIIAEKAVTVAKSPEQAAELIEAGDLVTPDDLVDRWGYDKTARMYYNIYQEVLGE